MTGDTDRALAIPELCLVVLVGATGSGKSTFAARNFGPYEVIPATSAGALSPTTNRTSPQPPQRSRC